MLEMICFLKSMHFHPMRIKYPCQIQEVNNKKFCSHYLANLIKVISRNNIYYGINMSLIRSFDR